MCQGRRWGGSWGPALVGVVFGEPAAQLRPWSPSPTGRVAYGYRAWYGVRLLPEGRVLRAAESRDRLRAVGPYFGGVQGAAESGSRLSPGRGGVQGVVESRERSSPESSVESSGQVQGAADSKGRLSPNSGRVQGVAES
jgi:hypothetical protein